MSSTTLPSTTPPPTRTTRATRRRSPRHPSSRLAAAVGAVGLALALAACGSSEPDTVEEAVAEAAGGEVPEALEDIAESLDEVEVPSDWPTPETYEEYKENQENGAASGDEDEAEAEESESESASQPGSGGSGNSPAAGDCLDHLPTGAEDTDAEAPIADCAGPHAADVIAVVELGDLGTEYPDPVTLFHTATDRCGDAYLERFGAPVIDTGVTPSFVSPTHETWEDGDTAVYCYAYPVGLETYSGELKAENQ